MSNQLTGARPWVVNDAVCPVAPSATVTAFQASSYSRVCPTLKARSSPAVMRINSNKMMTTLLFTESLV